MEIYFPQDEDERERLKKKYKLQNELRAYDRKCEVNRRVPMVKKVRSKNVLAVITLLLIAIIRIIGPSAVGQMASNSRNGLTPMINVGNNEDSLNVFEEKITEAACANCDSIVVIGCSSIKLKKMINDVQSDPDMFFVSDFETRINGYTSAIVTFELDYDNIKEKMKELDAETDKILAGISMDETDYHKALYVHDWLVNNITYKESDNDQSIYDALVTGECVCNGYAESFEYLTKKLGLESDTLIGMAAVDAEDERELHAWNSVVVDGQTYYVDVTWDDHENGVNDYSWFCISLSKISQTHFSGVML